jgi:transcriptional regulator
MYVPRFNEEKDVPTLHGLMESNPLGAWTTVADGDIVGNHIPFLLHRKSGPLGTLVGHVSRANNVWQEFESKKDSLVIFSGAQSYMSPNWYPSKHEHGKGVPTWCYTVVHAHGIPKAIEDPKWLLQHVNEQTNTHEGKQSAPWKVSDAPKDFIEMLIAGIVGIEIPITRLTGKWKLDQNRSEPDNLGVINGLMSTNDPQSHNVADHIVQHMQSKKGDS